MSGENSSESLENTDKIITKKEKVFKRIDKIDIRDKDKLYKKVDEYNKISESEDNKSTKKNEKKKCFSDYYKDEIWKEKHLNYIKEKIQCTCGCYIARSNMSNHQKTKLHEKRKTALESKNDAS
jgi:hypothetical protein